MRAPALFKTGLIYFALVFAAGFALAPLRELWAIPRFGERAGELMEMPIMLVVIVFAARYVVRRFRVPSATLPRLGIGIVALACLLLAEVGVVFWIRGFTLAEYVAARDPVSGGIYLAMLGVFCLMPLLVRRGRRAR